MSWDGTRLTIRIDEVTAPIPSRVRGSVTLHPAALVGQRFELDAAGRHVWQPIAPNARVEVRLDSPGLAWSGDGYLDHNAGSRPLEDDFRHWHWSRGAGRDGALILYDVTRRDGSPYELALRIDGAGRVEPVEMPPPAHLPRGFWGVGRTTRCAPEGAARVRQTLEDGPFYARSVIETKLAGETVEAVHESLSLDRFRTPIVQAMLPFRMPRRFM